MARWNVHNQVTNSAFSYCLEVVADRAYVHSLDETGLRFEHRQA
jgi:hypothetical protein